MRIKTIFCLECKLENENIKCNKGKKLILSLYTAIHKKVGSTFVMTTLENLDNFYTSGNRNKYSL